jgi:hypothetical protein
MYSYVWAIQSETEPPIVDKEQRPDMTSFGAWASQLFNNKQHLLGSWLSELGQEADKEYTRHIPRKGSSPGIQLLSVINHNNNNPTTTLFQTTLLYELSDSAQRYFSLQFPNHIQGMQ